MNDRLGYTFRDKITGFSGVATGHCEYLTGCHQTLIQPRAVEGGKLPESAWFDDQRLEKEARKDRVVLDNGATPGFDCEAPKR